MNTNVFCDRFEREGILRIERGLSLDTHFDECPTCDAARHKYESILAALPSAQPDVAPLHDWQSRVLHAATKSDATRPTFSLAGWSRPFVWTALAGAAALAAATFVGRPQVAEFEVQAETHAAISPAELAMDEANAEPTGDEEVTNTETNTEPVAPPAPVAPKPMPRHVAPMVQSTAPKAVKPVAPPPAPVKPSPFVGITLTQTEAFATLAPETMPQSQHHRVTRPNKLYGLKIKYPMAAQRLKVEGETSVQCTIHADGRNTNCRILKSLPYLDNAVIRAVEASRSDPIRVDGKPVDNSDHIWHITITIREIVDNRVSARNLPILNWN